MYPDDILQNEDFAVDLVYKKRFLLISVNTTVAFSLSIYIMKNIKEFSHKYLDIFWSI